LFFRKIERFKRHTVGAGAADGNSSKTKQPALIAKCDGMEYSAKGQWTLSERLASKSGPMKSYLAASLLLVGLAPPAFAAKHYAVEDTVNYCTVIDARPSPTRVGGLRVIGSKQGYDTRAAAKQALMYGHHCKKGIGNIIHWRYQPFPNRW
jgi:hypothetical protein